MTWPLFLLAHLLVGAAVCSGGLREMYVVAIADFREAPWHYAPFFLVLAVLVTVFVLFTWPVPVYLELARKK